LGILGLLPKVRNWRILREEGAKGTSPNSWGLEELELGGLKEPFKGIGVRRFY